MPRPSIALLLSLALSTGCVGKKKYDELANLYSQEQARTQSLEEALAAEQQKVADLDRQLDALMADKATLAASVDEMQAAMGELARRKAAAEARIKEYRDLLGKFQSMIDAGKLKVKVVDGRMVVELATDILFDSGKASLSKDGKASLLEVATLLSSIPGRRFQVEGHTDDVPIKTAQYPSNWELASARAIVVVQTMIEGGLARERLSAASFADTRPTASNDSKEGRAANRRIEIVLVPDLSTVPGFEELSRAASD